MSDMSSEELKAIKILSDQAIGAQSILYRTFQEKLNADKNKINKIELTYFSLSIIYLALLRYRCDLDKAKISSSVFLLVLEESIKLSRPPISIEDAWSVLIKRIKEYEVMMRDIGKSDENRPPGGIETTIMLHLFELSVRHLGTPPMLSIVGVSFLVEGILLDTIDLLNISL